MWAPHDLGSYLITTPDGNILINSDFDDTVPRIRPRWRRCFKFTNIKTVMTIAIGRECARCGLTDARPLFILDRFYCWLF
jgi:hypothetical protein